MLSFVSFIAILSSPVLFLGAFFALTVAIYLFTEGLAALGVPI